MDCHDRAEIGVQRSGGLQRSGLSPTDDRGAVWELHTIGHDDGVAYQPERPRLLGHVWPRKACVGQKANCPLSLVTQPFVCTSSSASWCGTHVETIDSGQAAASHLKYVSVIVSTR